MKGAVRLPVFIDDARKYVNTTQLRAKYLGASYEAEYCQWQTLHGLGSLMETASLIITPNAYSEGKLIASYPPDPIGDFDFVRATTATRVNSAGLVELVPYNEIFWSQDFSNASWGTPSAVVTSNTTTAPDGTLTADTISFSGSGNFQQYYFTSGVMTYSIYAKYIGTQWLCIENYNNADLAAWFDIQNGVVGNVVSGVTANIQSVGNGWYRCSISMATNNAFSSIYATFNVTANGIFTRTGSSYFWGAQLVQGTTAKDYQKTETRLNIPRLDYSNGTCPSLLVEPQRTNTCLYSSDFNAQWIGGVTSNTTISPDGNQNADTLAASPSQQLFQGINVSVGQTYTASFWVKLGTATNICLVINNQAAWNTIGGESFDSSDGLNTTTWTRVSYTFTSPSAGINFHIGGNGETGLTQSTGTVFLWGAQLEAGSYPTSYIPTTNASVTRNADVVSKTGISSLIGQTEGTMFFDLVFPQNQTPSYIGISDGTISNRIILGCESGTFFTFGYGYAVLSLTYNATNMKIYANGTLLATVTGSVPSGMSRLGFDSAASSQYLIGDVYACALWKTKLTDTQLATLTTI
jgi:hypothetical protein